MPPGRPPRTVPRTTPSTWFSLLFHVGSLYVLVSAWQNLQAPSGIANFISKQKGGWYQYLTVLGLYSSIITISLAILKDLFPSLRFLDYMKNTLGIVSVPAEGLISVLYWGIRSYDPKLMLPPDPRFQIPLALDLSLHAIPAAILWIDFLFLSPPFSEKSRPFLLSIALTTAYTTWMEYCRSRNGIFPYPFLGDLSLQGRITFYSGAAVVNVLLFKAANYIHFGVDKMAGRDLRRAQAQAKGRRK